MKKVKLSQRAKEKLIKVFAGALCLVGILYAGKELMWGVLSGGIKEKENLCVVIDAGHGGNDPGKVGVNGALEKEINLSIAKKLQLFLEAQDVEVIMTRTEDKGLYEEGASNKKVQDMKKRIAIIEKAQPDLVISIHQNSYHEESVKGAQVFYYNASTDGKELAQVLQGRLVADLDEENTRVEKANDTYYLLKKTSVPTVIVECGFLSNYAEADALVKEEYQEKIAWSLHLGILQYLKEE